MNQEEKQYMELLEHTVDLFEREVDAKDALIREQAKMIHYRNSLNAGEEYDALLVSGYEEKYKKILLKAKEEYEYIPASEYYREGYNLYLRMERLMKNHLLFLHDIRVPSNNNAAERTLRNYKRKQKQAVSFRSSQNHDDLCKGMSMLVMMRQNENNLFDRVSRILDGERTSGFG